MGFLQYIDYLICAFFKLIVGKSRIAYRKDVIRHLGELRAYHDKFGRDTSGFDEEIDRQQTKLDQLEGRY